MILIVNLTVMVGYVAPIEDDFATYYLLLVWRDPVTGAQLNLPVDREAPIDEQIKSMSGTSALSINQADISAFPQPIKAVLSLRNLYSGYPS